ncbi:glycoside hydrolase family 3 C-terminal domain-containing protein [Vallitalea pronyensis]|uniref:Glycoside hydrolase family 3 C-terminal domain-containing protein n=1 Tax=Vallitalea pronyensis TaxID=1348613 RepID=A0A8J8MIX8_9FIRM|nr:glycoside hydrolase family 3 N-terminal domain-containing protein [Vallitalea pronyensis]QUI22128.1 glycoside hydrolase family 3 C-terminal domain-containing protein [Vallitalea pronyensis]
MDIYKDSSKPVNERVNDLLSKMTIKEKIGQLNQKMLGWNAYKREQDNIILTQAFHKEVAFGDGLGAIYGLFRADGWNSHITMGISPKDSVRVANEIQQYVIEHTRLGIPVLLSEECPHGHEALEATTFPTNIGIGSSWNPDLYEQVCGVMAKEMRARGGHLGLISTLDIATDPRWGRTEECYGEDPYLASCFCESAVKGLQGTESDGLRNHDKVIAVVKHFCAQGATIGGHNGKSTNIGQRELHEIHLLGMQKAAKAGALGCMAAYNDIDGVPCHINKHLLTTILRESMGFEGFVMSDGLGVDRLLTITGDYEQSGAYALKAGVDLNLWNESFLVLESAIHSGHLTEKDLDVAVARILAVKFKLGLFEKPYMDEHLVDAVIGSEASKDMALSIAREVPVLLKNDHILPFDEHIKQIAVIGPNSHHVYNSLGDYTQWQEEGKVTTILEGIITHAPKDVSVKYAHGCSVRGMDKSEFDAAIQVAKNADVIVLVLGGSSTREANMTFEDNGALFMDAFTTEIDCGEAVDLADLSLGGVQQDLAIALKVLHKPLVTILIQGRPHAIPWFAQHSDAILCGWYPGEKGGEAIGEMLFGKVVPSGKLSISMPVSSAQLPVYYNRKDETPYVDLQAKPLYPFGYGLSYTRFVYQHFSLNHKSLSQHALEQGERFNLSFHIRNDGDYDAKEIAQLYIYDMESCITRRIKELRDFKKIHIPQNTSVQVTLSVGIEELSIYNYDMDFVLEPGQVKLMVGCNSDCMYHEEIVTIC